MGKRGSVHRGPMEAPGGDRVIASKPQGLMFGAIGPGKQGEA